MRRFRITNMDWFEQQMRDKSNHHYTERNLVQMMLQHGNKEDNEYIHEKYPELILKYPEYVI